MPPASEDDETTISEIHSVLCNFISTNAEAWAPIISTWSLELLGELSTRYAGRAHVSTGVNETLQLWMSCISTRTLIDVTTQCLSCLMNSDTEACISALLDTSVKHSPNFDWVVAHVGSCFPNTVITRVLSCGLKDFCQNKSYEQGCDSPKLKSVVGILGHLAGGHCNDIRTALLDLFNWSHKHMLFQDDSTKSQKKATVPFLLQLAYLSPTLFSTICKDIKKTLTLDVIVELYNYTDDWCKYFGSSESLQTLLVNLILKCDVGAVQIINLLMDCIQTDKLATDDECVKRNIRDTSREILELVLHEVDSAVRVQSQQNESVHILQCFVREILDVHELLLSPDKVKYQTAAQIVTFVGHTNPYLLINSITFLFENSKTDEQLVLIVKILFNELIDKTLQPYADKKGHFAMVLEQVLSKVNTRINLAKEIEDDIDSMLVWKNLLILLQWEKGEVFLLKSKIISRAIHANFISLTRLFRSEKLPSSTLHVFAELFEIFGIPSHVDHESYRIPIKALLDCSIAVVKYFFVCCNEQDEIVKHNGWRRVRTILKRLCLHSKAVRVLTLRELLEKSLYTKNSVLFGAKNTKLEKNVEFDKSVLEQNKRMSKTIPLTKHSSVFNGGIIGTGKRMPATHEALSQDVVAENTDQLLNTIKACCATLTEADAKVLDVSLDNVTLVSLLLVQFVSPDVMYNGLPWPEEEFAKVTIERDLYIRRLFNNNPVMWELLSFIAVYRPTLCYCSVLLRALTATLIHQWNSMGNQSKSTDTGNYNSLMDTTVKVLDVMALGQLLPPPLSGIRDVILYLKNSEIVQILRNCVWNYMRDNVPSPALFTCDSAGVYWRDPSHSKPLEMYTSTLRLIMQKNIKTVGQSYCQMFVIMPHSN
ncbi:integrator complex subunit 5 isoform X2 [Agrilus planipennis]|nr:integrator complex subunit 5 isoform X2 [Agrilus planipennis]